MKLNFIILIFGLLFMLSFISSEDLGSGVTPGKIKYGTSNVPFETYNARLIQDDPLINSYIVDNNLVILPMSVTDKDLFYSKLSLLEKTQFFLFGIPVKNLEGNVLSSKSINWDEQTIIKMDLTKSGIIAIGFNTDVYEITSLSNGVFNDTNELGGKIYLQTGKTTGSYFTNIIDLNDTKTILNISYGSNEPSGTDIGLRVRTHNMTNGTDISQGLLFYYKLDESSSYAYDYSGKNNTGTMMNGPNVMNVSGKYDNAIELDGVDDYINTTIRPYTAGNLSINYWINYDTLATNYQFHGTWNPWAETNARVRWGVATNKLYLTFGSFASSTVASGMVAKTWYMITITGNGSTVKMYVDGVEKISGAYTGAEPAAGTIWIGRTNFDTPAYYYPTNGKIDDFAYWNRTLTPTEITYLTTHEIKNWSGWSSSYTSSPSLVSVDDGRYVQVKASFTRPSTEDLHLDNLTIGYQSPRVPPVIDNPPTTKLVTINGKQFTINNATLTVNVTDDWDIVNISIFTNTTGTWKMNQTAVIGGQPNITFLKDFLVEGIADGTYLWNALSCDNATTPQCSMDSVNRTFSVSTSCVDSNCYPYLCNTGTNTCYSSCNAHSQVNSSSYCGNDGLAHDALPPPSDCAFKELLGLTDNEVCTSQLTGYCFTDNIGTTGEFCTNTADSCMNDGTEYAQSNYVCATGNDAFQCLGGESAWSSLIDCRDLGDSFDPSATVTGHTYCGYYNPETCSVSGGCVSAVPATIDCGSNYYNDVSDTCGAVATSSCDVGCGASYDLETCPFPNTLSSDCSTCTPPATDNPPEVTLASPLDSSTQSSTSITFRYSVTDESPLKNCSLYFKTDSIAWNLNQLNITTVSRISTNSFNPVSFSDGDNVTWNVECLDSIDQSAMANSNFTFTIDISAIGEKSWRWYNDSTSLTDNNIVFKISQGGLVNVSGDMFIGDSLDVKNIITDNSVNIPRLETSEYLDLISSGTNGIRQSNPYNSYIKFAGVGNLLFGLYSNNPYITTESGNYIEFGKGIRIGILNSTDTLWVNGVNSSKWLFNQSSLDGVYSKLVGGNSINGTQNFNGGFANGGVSIVGGTVYAQNVTFINISEIALQNVVFNGSIVPVENDTFNLGNESYNWKTGYFSTEVYISGVSVSTWAFNQSVGVNKWNVSGTNIFPESIGYSLGIGTNSPSSELDVVGTSVIAEISASSGNSELRFNSASFGDYYDLVGTADYFSIQESDADVLVVTDDSNVGILTTTPDSQLTVAGTGKINASKLYLNGTTQRGIYDCAGNTCVGQDSTDFMDMRDGGTYWNTAGNWEYFMGANAFQPYGNNTNSLGTQAVEWGAIFAGDINATRRLNVGNNNIQANTSSLYVGSQGDDGGITLFASDDNNESRLRIYENGGVSVAIKRMQAGSLSFIGSNGSIDAFIDSGGDLSINAADPKYKLEIGNSPKALNVSGMLYANMTGVGIGTSTPRSALEIYQSLPLTTGKYMTMNITTNALSQNGQTTTNYGIFNYMISSGATGTITSYGIFSNITGSGADATHYGLYSSASGGTKNYAGYFDSGNVYINNKLGIGTINPTYTLEIKNNATALNVSGNLYVNSSTIWTTLSQLYLNGNLTITENLTVDRLWVNGVNASKWLFNQSALVNIMTTGTINTTGTIKQGGCRTGFTLLGLGCIQTAEEGTGTADAASEDCYDTYGGRLPTVIELSTGENNLALTNEGVDEWTSGGYMIDPVVPGCEFLNADTGTGISNAFQQDCPNSVAYRCFIPFGGGL